MSTITAVSRAAALAAALAGTVLLAAACGGGSPRPAASPGQRLYQQALAYSQCMHSHGVPEFPDPKQGPGGTLVYPLNPPKGMLTSAGYDAAFRACLKLAAIGGGIHAPDFTTTGIDTHTPRFHAAGKACRTPGMWGLVWWWPAGSVQP